MNLFIDTPWESMTSSHAIFDNNNIIFLLVYIIMLLSGIILLASIPQLLDTEADYQQRKLLKSDRPTIVIDLCYIERYNTSNRRELFVYDKLDPTGIKMYSLFFNRGYDRSSHNGMQGYAGLVVARINNAQELPMAVSPLNLSLIENNGGAVLSNGVGIGKETVLVRHSSVPETRLLVKKG